VLAMTILLATQMVCKPVLHLEVHNCHIQDTTYLPNTRNTYKEKTKSYSYKPTKLIQYYKDINTRPRRK
jgi:hypothetical protein